MSSAEAASLARAALISLLRFCTKRSPTRLAGTSMAAMTSISSRVRKLIGRTVHPGHCACSFKDPICGTTLRPVHRHRAEKVLDGERFRAACSTDELSEGSVAAGATAFPGRRRRRRDTVVRRSTRACAPAAGTLRSRSIRVRRRSRRPTRRKLMSISGKVDPVVRPVVASDIAEALVEGLRDFQALPLYGLCFGTLYAAGGITIMLCLTAFGMVYLVYPLAAGFALLGPFVAIGLYEVSRRRERGEPVSLGAIWSTVRARSEIGWMAFVTLFVFVVWMYQVRLLIALLLGLHASFSSLQEFMTVVLTTNEGLLFLGIGNAVGAVLSLILFSLTVVSFPLLLDRDVDFVTAMVTSVRAVVTSPLPMITWAAVVVMLPVLGHATWHLYRRLVVPVA